VALCGWPGSWETLIRRPIASAPSLCLGTRSMPCGAAALAALAWFWRKMLAATLHDELARIDGVRVDAINLLLMLLLALVIAVSGRMVGILLVVALLVIPAATARRFAKTPEQMAFMAALAGALAVAGGLWGSFRWDIPTGPSMVVAAGLLCILAWMVPRRRAA
jgi:zinc transport system permease protein